MRKKFAMIGIPLLGAALLFSVFPCTKRIAPPPTASTNFVGVAPARTEIPEPAALVAELKSEGSGQTTGKATFAKGDSGVGSKITVEITGAPPGAHLNYIYHNNCKGEGEKHGPLSALNADASGAASGVTNFISLSMSHFVTGSHFLAVHGGATSETAGPAIACGEIKDPTKP